MQSPFFLPGTNTPGNGVQLFTYLAGSVNTKVTVYKDPAGATPWTNPIVLDSGGRLPTSGELWIPAGTSIKAVYAPSNDGDPPTSPYLTYDNLSGINDTTVSVSEWQAGPAPTFVSSTSFTLAGDQTATFTRGRRVKTTNTAGTVYSTIVNSVFGALTTITVVNDSPGVLDSGLSAVFYGLLSSNNGSIPGVSLSSSGAFSFQQPISLTVSSSSFKQTFYPTSSAANVSTIVPATNITLNAVGTGIRGVQITAPGGNGQITVTAREYDFRNAQGIIKTQLNATTYVVDTAVAQAINGRDQAAAFSAGATVHFYAAFNDTAIGGILSTAGPTSFAGPNTTIAGYLSWVYGGSYVLTGTNFQDFRQADSIVKYSTKKTLGTGLAASTDASVSATSAPLYIPLPHNTAQIRMESVVSNLGAAGSFMLEVGSASSTYTIAAAGSAATGAGGAGISQGDLINVTAVTYKNTLISGGSPTYASALYCLGYTLPL